MYGNLTNTRLLLFIETESTEKNWIYEKIFQLQNEQESVSCVRKGAVMWILEACTYVALPLSGRGELTHMRLLVLKSLGRQLLDIPQCHPAGLGG